MSGMFYQAILFNQDLTSWNVNNVKYCILFNCFGEGNPVYNEVKNVRPNTNLTTIPKFNNCLYDCN